MSTRISHAILARDFQGASNRGGKVLIQHTGFAVADDVGVTGTSPVGVLDWNLQSAYLRALKISRQEARQYAEGFSWENSARQFESYLAPIRAG